MDGTGRRRHRREQATGDLEPDRGDQPGVGIVGEHVVRLIADDRDGAGEPDSVDDQA
jgi:hypothetical protein